MISVVIPIYNVEKYISEALDSVLSQSLRDIEVILVDDGSPDACGEICDRYAEQDSRVRVYHIPNGGVAKARQLGVEMAKGEWITFVDGDDTLPVGAMQALSENICDEVDIVIGSSSRFYESGKVRYVRFNDHIASGDEWIKRIITNTPNYIVTPWARIYRRELFTQSSFPRLKRAQDWMMNIELSSRVNGVKMIEDVVYNYRSPFGTGRTQRIDLEYTKSLFTVLEGLLTESGLIKKYQLELLTAQLSFISHSIKNRCYIDSSDEWIQKICASTMIDKLTLMQRATIKSLGSLKTQKRRRRRIKRDELIKKITRWIYTYTSRRPRQTT